jgi:hypothetical protein
MYFQPGTREQLAREQKMLTQMISQANAIDRECFIKRVATLIGCSYVGGSAQFDLMRGIVGGMCDLQRVELAQQIINSPHFVCKSNSSADDSHTKYLQKEAHAFFQMKQDFIYQV